MKVALVRNGWVFECPYCLRENETHPEMFVGDDNSADHTCVHCQKRVGVFKS